MPTLRKLLLTLAGVLCTLAGCSRDADQQEAVATPIEPDAISICVVNYPLKYFAQQIGGERVTVEFPAPTDGDPAYWTPAADDIIRMQQADLILLNGADYAKWVATVSLPSGKIVNTSSEIGEQLIQLEDATTHSHGPQGEHAHGGLAFTTWLDLQLAVAQARVIYHALAERWPEHEDLFEAGFASLERELIDIDTAIENVLTQQRDTPLVFSHPVYQYFQRRYKLSGKSVHWEPDELPTDEQWTNLAELLKQHDAKWMIWESEPLPETVARLREMGLESVVFDPCSNTPEGNDFLAMLRKNLSVLADAFGGGGE